MYKDNTADYQEVGAILAPGFRFYTPTNIADPMEGYHSSRYIEAANQQVYAANGISEESQAAVIREVKKICDSRPASGYNDISLIMNTLEYRQKHPIDQYTSLRIGAIYCFMEYEDTTGKTVSEPKEYHQHWISRKMEMAFEHPDLYTFFLSTGIARVPQYERHLNILMDPEFFVKRKMAIQAMLPESLRLDAFMSRP